MRFRPGDALLIVDVQNDFLLGGSLAIPRADAVVPVLNRYVRHASASGTPVFATRDWHPPHHASFHKRGGPWPSHCVQATRGAELASDLRLPADAVVVSKGAHPDRDAYSAFDATTLEAMLGEREIERLFVGGLATDVCVLRTVRDARARGYAVLLLDDAIRGVDPSRSDRARREMLSLGAVPITLGILEATGTDEPTLAPGS